MRGLVCSSSSTTDNAVGPAAEGAIEGVEEADDGAGRNRHE